MKKLLIAGACLALGVASYADTVVLNPSQDSTVWFRVGSWDDIELGATADHVDIYSYQDGSAIGAYGYVQFDLSGLGDITINSAILSITQVAANTDLEGIGSHSTRNDGWTDDRINFYGLNSIAGNTSQTWTEGLSYNQAGLEVKGASPATDPFDVAGGRSADFSTMNTLGVLSDAAVDTWLQGRVDDNGFATFLVDFNASGRGSAFYSSESATGAPVLSLDYTVIPEPATLGLVGVFGAGVLFIRRRLAM